MASRPRRLFAEFLGTLLLAAVVVGSGIAAQTLSPGQVSDIAAHAEKTQPGIVDEVSSFYAQHAGLIKMLGGAALAITMAKMKQNATRG